MNLLPVIVCSWICAWATPLVAAVPPPEKVRLQLKWMHSFQFAGYYAAREKGFYAEENLDVNLIERTEPFSITDRLLQSQAEYGIGDAGLLLERLQGKPVVMLAAIYQHSPMVLISLRNSGIVSPYEMPGRKVMYDLNDRSPIAQMFYNTGIREADINRVPQEMDNQILLRNKAEVTSAYLGNEPFLFRERGIDINIINPLNYGVDHPGDLLYTTEAEIRQHPQRVEKFRRASLKGWHYALDHPQEVIDIILKQYDPKHQATGERLTYQADELSKLIMADRIPLGQIDPHRFNAIHDNYIRLGLARPGDSLKGFLYGPSTLLALQLSAEEQQWLSNHPVIRVGAYPDFPPYQWQDQPGRFSGLTTELLDLLAAQLGVHFETVTENSRRGLLDMLENGQVDIVPLLAKTPGDNHALRLTTPYLSMPAMVFAREETRFFGGIDTLGNDHKVAVRSGEGLEPKLMQKNPGIRLATARNTEEALQWLQAGQVDVYIAEWPSTRYKIRQAGFSSLHIVGQSDQATDYSMAVRHDDPVLFNILEKALACIPAAETHRLHERWLNKEVAADYGYRDFLYQGSGLLAVSALLAGWIALLRREIRARKRAEKNLREREHILENLTRSHTLHESLSHIIQSLENSGGGRFRGCVTLIGPRSNLELYAPNLPPSFQAALTHLYSDADQTGNPLLEILETGHELLIDDMLSSPGLRKLNRAVARSQLKLCRGVPIRLQDRSIIGSACLFYPDSAMPEPEDRELLDRLTHLALLAEQQERSHSQERLLQGFVGTLDTPMYILDPADGFRLYYVNQAAIRHFRYPEKQILSLRILDIDPDYDEARIQAFWQQLKREGNLSFESVHKLGDGQIVPVEIHATYLNQRGHEVVSGYFRDISARKQTEKTLRDSEQRFRNLFEHSPQAYLSQDIDGHLIDVNPELCKHLGYRAEELLNQPFHAFWSATRRAGFLAHYGRFLQEGQVSEEIELMTREGQVITVQLDGQVQRNEAGDFVKTHCVLTDISARKEFEQSLLAAKENAESTTRLKSEFLANMSHEIRTPMNAIIGLSQLGQGMDNPALMKNYLTKIHYSATNLLGIINDILDYSKIESGRFVIERIPFSINRVVKDVWNLADIKADAKNLKLLLDLDSQLPEVLLGDTLRLRQVLTNLVDNAIKFTHKGSVTLQLRVEANEIHQVLVGFRIVDTGIGMNEQARGRLFKAFSQADASTTRQYGGSGLGLVISANLVKLMGGSDVEVSSVPGQSSQFSFSLPFPIGTREMLAPEADTTDDQATDPVSHIRVMVAEDNPINQLVIEAMLKRMGIRPVLVSNGLEAVDHLKAHPDAYDIVLMDIQMPVMDGYEATRIIRNELDLPRLPIIATTAHAMTDERERCLTLGMNAHVSKPIDMVHLRKTMVSLLELRQPDPDSVAPVNRVAESVVRCEWVDEAMALANLDGDTALYHDMVMIFLNENVNELYQLKDLIRQQDQTSARRIVHTAKGLGGTLGLPRLRETLQTLDQALKDESLARIPELLDDMERALEPTVLELGKHYSTHPDR
jgi:PAS domain S-box-containing protein